MANALQVLDMVDAIGAFGPSAIPRGTKVAAVYVTGSGGIAWSSEQIAELQRNDVRYVLRIDQSNSQADPYLSVKLLVVDVEPGAAVNLTASHIAAVRAARGLYTLLYCDQSTLPGLRAAVQSLGIQGHVRYWVADWNLDRNGAVGYIEQNADVIAVQYESLSTTDRSVVSLHALEGVYGPLNPAKPKRVRKVIKAPVKKVVKVVKQVHPKVVGTSVPAAVAAGVVAYLQHHGVHLSSALLTEIPVIVGAIGGILAPSRK